MHSATQKQKKNSAHLTRKSVRKYENPLLVIKTSYIQPNTTLNATIMLQESHTQTHQPNRNYRDNIRNLSNANYQTNQIINAMECNRVVALYEKSGFAFQNPRHTHTECTPSWSIMFVAFSDILSTAKDSLFAICIFCVVSVLSFALFFRTKWIWLLTGNSVTGNVRRDCRDKKKNRAMNSLAANLRNKIVLPDVL